MCVIAGLDSGVYALYTTATNTNTTVHDSYNIYSFEGEPGVSSTSFEGKAAVCNGK